MFCYGPLRPCKGAFVILHGVVATRPDLHGVYNLGRGGIFLISLLAYWACFRRPRGCDGF